MGVDTAHEGSVSLGPAVWDIQGNTILAAKADVVIVVAEFTLLNSGVKIGGTLPASGAGEVVEICPKRGGGFLDGGVVPALARTGILLMEHSDSVPERKCT